MAQETPTSNNGINAQRPKLSSHVWDFSSFKCGPGCWCSHPAISLLRSSLDPDPVHAMGALKSPLTLLLLHVKGFAIPAQHSKFTQRLIDNEDPQSRALAQGATGWEAGVQPIPTVWYGTVRYGPYPIQTLHLQRSTGLLQLIRSCYTIHVGYT